MTSLASERLLTQLTLLIIGVALFVTTLGDASDTPVALSPIFFPQIILGLWIGLTLIDLLQDLARRRDLAQSNETQGVGRLAALLLCIVAAVVYLNTITVVGFAISSAVFCVVSLILFGVQNPIFIGLYAVAVPGALVLLFNHLLKMPLPTSPFTYLF